MPKRTDVLSSLGMSLQPKKGTRKVTRAGSQPQGESQQALTRGSTPRKKVMEERMWFIQSVTTGHAGMVQATQKDHQQGQVSRGGTAKDSHSTRQQRQPCRAALDGGRCVQWDHGCLEKDQDLPPRACWHWGKGHYWNNTVSICCCSAGGESSSELPKGMGQGVGPPGAPIIPITPSMMSPSSSSAPPQGREKGASSATGPPNTPTASATAGTQEPVRQSCCCCCCP